MQSNLSNWKRWLTTGSVCCVLSCVFFSVRTAVTTQHQECDRFRQQCGLLNSGLQTEYTFPNSFVKRAVKTPRAVVEDLSFHVSFKEFQSRMGTRVVTLKAYIQVNGEYFIINFYEYTLNNFYVAASWLRINMRALQTCLVWNSPHLGWQWWLSTKSNLVYWKKKEKMSNSG